jgi:integrase
MATSVAAYESEDSGAGNDFGVTPLNSAMTIRPDHDALERHFHARTAVRALRELRRQTEAAFVFASERGGPMTRFNVSKMVEAAGERAGLPYAHPHMLWH